MQRYSASNARAPSPSRTRDGPRQGWISPRTRSPQVFPNVSLEVKARAGRALLWTNVLARRTLAPDLRTRHEAQLVARGVKWVATTWLHAFQFAANHRAQCCTAGSWPNASVQPLGGIRSCVLPDYAGRGLVC